MPFPNPRVLTSFLREYLYYRQMKTWSTTTGWIQSLVRDDASFKTGQCLKANRLFYNNARLQTLDGWIDLAYTLGEMGREQSLFAETLQAIRCYIIAFLKASEHKPALEMRAKELRRYADSLDKQIMDAYEAKESPEQVNRLNDEYHKTLLRLADLGDTKAINQAERLGLFNQLEHPNLSVTKMPMFNDLNANIPFAYHDIGHLILYYRFIKPLEKWQVPFENFVSYSESLPAEIEEPVQQTFDSKTAGLRNAVGGFFATAKTTLFGTPVTETPATNLPGVNLSPNPIDAAKPPVNNENAANQSPDVNTSQHASDSSQPLINLGSSGTTEDEETETFDHATRSPSPQRM